MKIAVTTDTFNNFGGISRYVYELAKRFSIDNEVHIYSTHIDNYEKNIHFHKIPTISSPRLLRSIPFTLQNTLKLLYSKYDIIHTNGCDSLYQDVITAHSIHKAGMDFRKNIHYSVKGLGLLDTYNLFIENQNYSHRNYKKIICDSSSSKDELMKYYHVPKEDIVVIPLGVNTDEFYPINNIELKNLREKYNISQNDIVLIIVATEFYRKGIEELIKAMNILVNIKKYENIKLLIVGNAGNEGTRKGNIYYKEIAKKLNVYKNIIFAGSVENINLYYNISDIFVFPTKYEAFGIPMLEAMAAGLPVLNSKIGAGELITNNYDGIYIDNPNNVTEISDKIELLMCDKNKRFFLGRNARETAKKYTWNRTAKETMEIYKNI